MKRIYLLLTGIFIVTYCKAQIQAEYSNNTCTDSIFKLTKESFAFTKAQKSAQFSDSVNTLNNWFSDFLIKNKVPKKTEGYLMIIFILGKDGSLCVTQIKNATTSKFDYNNLINFVLSLKWQPAVQNGYLVNSFKRIMLYFKDSNFNISEN